MPITGLGHTGLWVNDLARCVTSTSGCWASVTDEDDDLGIVFFSARPDAGAPRVRPAAGPDRRRPARSSRTRSPGGSTPWRRSSSSTTGSGTRASRSSRRSPTATPSGSTSSTPRATATRSTSGSTARCRQPFRKTLDLDQPPEQVLADAERLLAGGGPAYQPVQ